MASAAGPSAISTSARRPLSRGGSSDPTPTPEPRSPVVPLAGRFFLIYYGRVGLYSESFDVMCILFFIIKNRWPKLFRLPGVRSWRSRS